MDARNINQIHDERRTASNDPRDVYDHCAVLRAPVSIFTATNIPRYQPQFGALVGIIEILGEGSARAQGLRSAVTSIQKLMHNLSHRLYVMRSELEVEETEHHAETDVMEQDYQSERVNSLEKAANEIVGVGELNIHELEQQRDTRAPKYKTCKAIGIMKVGIKKLFVSDESGRQLQISPLCVLDFYIHESMQRSGKGKKLFDCMLANEQLSAGQLAYDRPSPRMVSFLRKHYGLVDYIPQANNFMIFKQFGLASINQDSRKRGFETLSLHPSAVPFTQKPRIAPIPSTDSLSSNDTQMQMQPPSSPPQPVLQPRNEYTLNTPRFSNTLPHLAPSVSAASLLNTSASSLESPFETPIFTHSVHSPRRPSTNTYNRKNEQNSVADGITALEHEAALSKLPSLPPAMNHIQPPGKN